MGYSYLIWFLVKIWDLSPWRQPFPPRRLVAGAGPARPARPGHGPLGRRRPLRSGHEGRPCGAVDVGCGSDGGGRGGWKVAGRATQISPGNGGWFRERLGRNGGTQQRFREVRKWEIISEGDSKHSMGRWGFEWDSQQSLWGFNEARQSMYGGAWSDKSGAIKPTMETGDGGDFVECDDDTGWHYSDTQWTGNDRMWVLSNMVYFNSKTG